MPIKSLSRLSKEHNSQLFVEVQEFVWIKACDVCDADTAERERESGRRQDEAAMT